MQFTVNRKNISLFNDGFIFVIVIFFALFLRTFQLNNRPMHTDEAVHAVKFGKLLEDGIYIYDPLEYHGPTLNYFTLIPAWILGENNFSELTEQTLRIVPAIISLLLIVIFIPLFRRKEKELLFLISFLLAISPGLVFYSRYYIQEILLVTFTFSVITSFYKYWISQRSIWIFSAAMFSGLTFATKETSIITFASAIFAFVILLFFDKNVRAKITFKKYDLLIFIFTFLFISILFYSSFFTNAKGVADSVLTFANYFTKASGVSEQINGSHNHPFFYYFDLMLFSKNSFILFTQLPLFIFTLIGVYFSFSNKYIFGKKRFFKFITLFSFTQALVYSLIPYKTPWLQLNFWIGFIILAAFGINTSFNLIKERNTKIIFTLLIFLIFAHNVSQTYVTSFKYSYNPENPFTYSQPTKDILTVAERVINVAKATPRDTETFVNVIVSGSNYWPLPWYLRKLKNIAWNNNVPNSAYKFQIILATPNFEDELIQKLFSIPPPGKKNLYLPLFDEHLTLRPGVEIRGYVQKDFYDYFLRNDNKTDAVLKGGL